MNTSPSQRQIVYAEDAFHAADAAYGQLPAGWRERTDTFGAQELKNANAHHFESPDGTQFLAFRGTKLTSISDLWNDVKQPLGGASKYAAAAELGRQVRDQNLDVAFAGHSLGGGLAKVAAEAASTPKTPGAESRSYIAVSFNGSPVGPATYKGQGLTAQDHLRTTYHVLTSSERDAIAKTDRPHANEQRRLEERMRRAETQEELSEAYALSGLAQAAPREIGAPSAVQVRLANPDRL